MKKIISLFIVLLMLTAAFAGCAEQPQTDSNPPASEPAATDSSEPVETESKTPVQENATISFIHWRSEDANIYKELVSMFEDEYPNIKVQMEVKSANQDEYYSALTTKLSGTSNTIDVFAVHAGARLTEYVNAGKMLDLTGSNIANSYNSELLGFGTVDGKVYGVPQAYNSYLIFYNKAIFDQYQITPPTTWAEMQQVVKTLADNGVAPIAAGFAEDWVFDMVVLPLVAAYNTGDSEIFRKVQDGEVKFTDDSIRKIFADIQEMGKEAFFQKGSQGTTYESSLAVFAQKNTAMLLTGTWSIGGLQTQAPDIEQGYFLLPASGASPIMLADASHLVGINANSSNIEAAKTFLAFLSSPETAAKYSQATGQLSPVIGVQSEDKGLATVTQMFSENTVVNNPNRYLTSSEFISIYTSTAAKAYLGENLDKILADAQAARDAL